MTASKNRTPSSATPLTRRKMIQSLAATSATAATAVTIGVRDATAAPVEAGADEAHADARLIQLMLEWRAAQEKFNSITDWDCAADHPLMTRLHVIEYEAASITPKTAQGFAIKLLMLTAYGDHDFDGPAAGLYAEAERLSGFPRGRHADADVAVITAASAAAVSPELAALIDAHKHAWDAFGDAIDAADDCHENYAGLDAERIKDLADEREEACLVDVALFPSKGPADDQMKWNYLVNEVDHFEGYAPAIIDRLARA